MEKYERLKKVKRSEFKRLVGVKKETVEVMLEVCEAHHKEKKGRGGKPNSLSMRLNAQFNAQKKAIPMLQRKEKATHRQRANRD